jgi:hypothetical protein
MNIHAEEPNCGRAGTGVLEEPIGCDDRRGFPVKIIDKWKEAGIRVVPVVARGLSETHGCHRVQTQWGRKDLSRGHIVETGRGARFADNRRFSIR